MLYFSSITREGPTSMLSSKDTSVDVAPVASGDAVIYSIFFNYIIGLIHTLMTKLDPLVIYFPNSSYKVIFVMVSLSEMTAT